MPQQPGLGPSRAQLYFDAAASEYVTALGKAELVANSAGKAGHWKDQWAGFCNDQNHGLDYVLIRVRPWRLDALSPSHGLKSDSTTWRPVTLDLP